MIIKDDLPGNIKIEELLENINNINNKIKVIMITENQEFIESNFVYRTIEKLEKEKILDILYETSIFEKQKISINNIANINKKEGKIITILGPNGIGKSVFSINFASNIENKKILIIDFDVLNNSLHTLLGVEEYSKKIQKNINKDYIEKMEKESEIKQRKINIEDFIIKTKMNVDLISGINMIFDSKYQISPNKIKNIINKIREEYDLIIIDTSSECFLEYTKELIKLSSKSIFISGANVLEIKKSKTLLNIYENEWGISKENINIIFNKCTNQSIENETLKNIFCNYKIIGKIRLSDYYDVAINNNDSKLKEIKRDISKIKTKLFKIEKSKDKNNIHKKMFIGNKQT